jgi:hypothetical protein
MQFSGFDKRVKIVLPEARGKQPPSKYFHTTRPRTLQHCTA